MDYKYKIPEKQRKQFSKKTISLQDLLHVVVILLIISTLFVPSAYIKYVLPVPPFLYLLWLICDGCPLSDKVQVEGEGEMRENFIHRLLSMLVPRIKETQCDMVIGLVLTSILMVQGYRLIY